jgi:hypothetical protein
VLAMIAPAAGDSDLGAATDGVSITLALDAANDGCTGVALRLQADASSPRAAQRPRTRLLMMSSRAHLRKAVGE